MKEVNFRFDGRALRGREGQSLATALLANGVRVVGRSFKLHRPRGIMGLGVEEPNAFVQLAASGFEEPNVRATLQPLYEGLDARTQNAWPSVDFDLHAMLGWLHRFLPASFYYKTMMWPNWHFFERIVRPIAGLGKAPQVPDAQHYEVRNLHCDVLVCGGGPSGLQSALVAARAGLRVVLADDGESFGGHLLGERLRIDGAPAAQWVVRAVERLAALENVTLLPRTTVSGYYEHNVLACAERVTNHLGVHAPAHLPRERLWRVRAGQVVLATGAIERPMVFPNNDRPGVMFASAVRHYVNRHGVACGQRVVVATNNDSAYGTALDLHAHGLRELTVVDSRRDVSPALAQALAERQIRHMTGCAVRGVKGRKGVRAAKVSPHLGGGCIGSQIETLRCDLLAVSSGWTPSVHLFSQAGGSLRYDPAKLCLVPDRCAQQVLVAGAAAGDFGLNDCLLSGARAGDEVVRRLSGRVDASTVPRADDEPTAIEACWYAVGLRTEKQWLDFQYDVKVSDVELAVRENFVSVEHVKRYTTGGMSVDQGKTSNFNILAVIAELTQRAIPQVGTTKFRPPFQPVTLGTFAGLTVGEKYAPWRELPAKPFHDLHHARYGDYGWRRPDYYPRDGEDLNAAMRREVRAVRQGVGLFDGSPLGKIEVVGPDAATFLNRFYVNNLLTLKPGYARYAMLTNENGVLIDDGVIVRRAEHRFLVHATSAAVDRVALLMEQYLQCEWPELRVHVHNVTTAWANATLSGPKARDVMQALDSDIDLSRAAFPHMQYREGRVAGLPARVLRASFTGEVTFEVSVPVGHALTLWQRLAEAGRPCGITPYGIEALGVMRTEKGYLHIGGDTDGTTNPLDIGWGSLIDKKKDDFVGRRSLARPEDRKPNRLHFVGIEADGGQRLPVGGHVIGPATGGKLASQGYVTSSCISPTLERSIGLGLVMAGRERLGEVVEVYARGARVKARIVAPAHFDPQGERLNG